MLDGRNLSDYDVHHLRRHIGVVAQVTYLVPHRIGTEGVALNNILSQENVLFSTSIRENIVYGMGQARLNILTHHTARRIKRQDRTVPEGGAPQPCTCTPLSIEFTAAAWARATCPPPPPRWSGLPATRRTPRK